MLQSLGTKQVEPEAFAETGVYIPELALSLTKPLKMEPAALVFGTVAITIFSEIFKKILVESCLCQKTVISNLKGRKLSRVT